MPPVPPNVRDYLATAEYVWLTTVRDDGMPQPTPVWFIIEGDDILIYSMPNAQKVKNLRANPHAALAFTPQDDAESFVVAQGTARLSEDGAPFPQAYLDKYREPMREISTTPDQMQREYSIAIRITVTHSRVQ